MSTPANIAELDKQGHMHIANVAMDGYLNQGGVGNVLLNAYQSPKKVDRLIKLGNLAHVGYTTKQANVFKEAGDNWSEHTGVGSTVSGKDASGKYTSPKDAKANRKKQNKWDNQVDNYTHAFQRDWGRSHDEDGSTAKVNMNSKNYLSNAMKTMNRTSEWESEYNYLYDGTKNKWYYNNPGDDKVQPLDKAVNLQDQQEMKQDYRHFKQHPINPKLPQMNSHQIHKAIHKALYGPRGTNNLYGLQNDLTDIEGTVKSNLESVSRAQKELKTGDPTVDRMGELQSIIYSNGNPKLRHEDRKHIQSDKAQIRNLKLIDKFVTKHPDVHLYPNDLNINRHMGAKFANNEKRFETMQNSPKAQLAKIRNGLISKYIQNPHAKPVNPMIGYEKPLARYGQPIYDGQTGAITSLKNMFGTKKLSKPIPRSKVQQTLKSHGKQINKTLNFYKNNPKHRALLMKSHGYMNKNDIDTYLRDNKIIDMYHHQGKLSDHQRDLAKEWYVKDTAAYGIKDDMYADAGVPFDPKAPMNGATLRVTGKEMKLRGDAQRMMGMKDVPKDTYKDIGGDNPDADFINKFSDKLDNADTIVENYESNKKANDFINEPTKKPKLVQQLDDFDEHQMKDGANKVTKLDSDSMMSAFKSARNKGVSNDTQHNKQSHKHVANHKRSQGTKPTHKTSHKINHGGLSLG